MKTNKSTDETKITPSKKKLKQARLPFKLISDVPPTPVPPQTRKRKLSAPEIETVSKIGKICKENDLVEETVIISDDESKDGSNLPKQNKIMNPYVKLIDAAWKKKQKKTKVAKKKKGSIKKNVNASLESEENDIDDQKLSKEVEMMDVDKPDTQENDILPRNNSNNKYTIDDKIVSDNIVVLDSSTDSSDVKIKTGVRNSDETNDASFGENENQSDNESPSKSDKDTLFKTKKNTELNKSQKNYETISTNTETVIESSPSHIKTESAVNVGRCVSSHDQDVLIVKDNQMEAENNENMDISEEDNEKNNVLENSVTPKRSTRNKQKMEQNNKSKNSPSNSKSNDSLSSNTSTPRNNKDLPASNEEPNESLDESLTSIKNLTPRQLQKKQEAAKRKEERDRERQELEKKRQQEKEERAKQKHEKEEQRRREREEKDEQKRREKEEKEEQRKKEREEKEKQKELERKLKEEKEELKKKEKEEKEEQKRKEKETREEEKRKKQEALEMEKQEQELKKKKAAEAFANFFVPIQKSEKDQTTVGPVSKNEMLSNFTIKADMRLAPTKRVHLSDARIQKLDNLLIDQTDKENILYLKSLKDGIIKPLSSGKTWPKTDKEDEDVMIVEDELLPMDGAGEITCESAPREKLRPKLLSFHENRRPPYWGTWRKKSPFIKPRKPFGQDGKHLDYEVDSDDEWEEEQEGESIDGSAAGSDEEQDADEYEVDNEVFVPHGYLSDEEATMDDDDVLSLTPETQKARLKHLEYEFETEMKKPTEKLKPRMYGLLWQTVDADKPAKCVDALWDYFGKFSMIMNNSTVVLEPPNVNEDTEKKKVKKKKPVNNENGEQKSPKSDKKKKQKLDDKETTTVKKDSRKNVQDNKNQPSINAFLNKLKSP